MATKTKTTVGLKPRRTSEGSGKTKGAVSLAFVNLRELLTIVNEDAKIPIGRVFGESLGFHTKKGKSGRTELVLD